MLSMLRIRRRTIFLALASFVTILLIRFSYTSSWDHYGQVTRLDFSSAANGGGHEKQTPPGSPPPGPVSGKAEENKKGSSTNNPPVYAAEIDDISATSSTAPSAQDTSASPTVPTDAGLPDQKFPPPKVTLDDKDAGTDLHPIRPPGRQEFTRVFPSPTAIHWKKQEEHFPVPTESIIKLPTAAPAAIPPIQHTFSEEKKDAQNIRETRQAKVKEEFKKAWTGYKTHAWLHDELSPESGKFRDPFCGWAATLVDSLDTLWIMGLQEEFEEAAEAVDKIDFTTSPRTDIPMFETTIRYLGGLLGAYDVSGGKYKNLLSKAEELAEVLIGAFDTPNRMPILYYNWKPAFASQPHRAGQRSNLAELGSLSLEFTRLAQLTRDPRYYDAVARVTNALAEFQDRTKLTGLFPSDVDASGCNRTAKTTPKQLTVQEPEGYMSSISKASKGKSKDDSDSKDTPSLEQQALPAEPDAPAKRQIAGWDENRKSENSKRDLEGVEGQANDVSKPEGRSEKPGPLKFSIERPPLHPVTGLPLDMSGAKAQIGKALGDWDCEPGGLESSTPTSADSYSMGGGQDSTYEYLPKQYLLLGGREDKYRKMYLKTIEAIRTSLLFRPMLPESPDILFSGSLVTDGKPDTNDIFSGEIEHLTCFIGGMVGMGARIFDIKDDLEVAKKLADGCVWAYGSMPAEIMAESALVLPCDHAEHCVWNETLYNHYLDPIADTRDRELEEYLAKKAARKAEEAAKKAAEEQAKLAADQSGTNYHSEHGRNGTKSKPEDLASGSLRKRLALEASKNGTAELRKSAPQPKDQSTENEDLPDPHQPPSHKEWVANLIEQSRLPPGYVKVRSKNYILRPEAIESVWYMYRITGDPAWQAKGWMMFEAVIKATSAQYGHSAIRDVTTSEPPILMDQMESFWLAETLKYFYLLFSTPDTISLDEWVLNTEAHPFKRDA